MAASYAAILHALQQANQGGALQLLPVAPQAPGPRLPSVRAEDPDFLQYQLMPLQEEEDGLMAALRQAQAFGQPQQGSFSNPWAAGLGALTNVVRAGASKQQQDALGRELKGVNQRRQQLVTAAGQGPSAAVAKAVGGRPQKSTDPNSEASKRAQLLVKATLSDKFTDEEIAQLTEADAEYALKYGSLSGQREVTREGHTDTNKRAEESRTLQREQGDLDRNVKWAQIFQAAEQFGASQELKLRLAEMEREEKEKDRAAKKDEQVAGATERFGDEIDKTGAPKFYQQYDEAQALLKKYPKDIPGIGRLDGRKPDEALSEDGRQIRFLVGQLLSEYRKGQTGLGMSEGERAEYAKITGLLDTGNDGAIRQGLDTLRRALDARVKAKAAGFRPEAVETYGQRNPRVGEVVKPKPSDSAPNSEATSKPKAAAGQPSRADRKLDPTKAEASRSYSKDGKWMRVTYEDGTYGLAPSDKKR